MFPPESESHEAVITVSVIIDADNNKKVAYTVHIFCFFVVVDVIRARTTDFSPFVTRNA